MLVVIDGSNFNAQFKEKYGREPDDDDLKELLNRIGPSPGLHVVRVYWFGSYDPPLEEDKILEMRERYRKFGFTAYFSPRKPAGKSFKEKGLDIQLTSEIYDHLGQVDIVRLVAGDADYVPLVERIKRHTVNVEVAFFQDQGLSRELKVSADQFIALTSFRS